MRPEDYRQLKEQLIKHEGLRLKPYRDSVGKLTVGVGRNLDDVGITYTEAMIMLDTDVMRAVEDAKKLFWFKGLDIVRQDAVLNMLLNLGLPRFKTFKKLITALVEQNYPKAAEQMLDSRWAEQVGIRAEELAKQMRTGVRV
jgi:lysozyme